jgi:hypothetical protein
MADLMAQHSRQFGLRIEVGQDPPADIDVAAGIGKGIDDGIVHHPKSPGQVGTLRVGGEFLAHFLHIVLEPWAVVVPEGLLHLRLGLLTDGYLLLLANERDLFFAGGGVGGTAHGQNRGCCPHHEQLDDRSYAPIRHHRLPVSRGLF